MKSLVIKLFYVLFVICSLTFCEQDGNVSVTSWHYIINSTAYNIDSIEYYYSTSRAQKWHTIYNISAWDTTARLELINASKESEFQIYCDGETYGGFFTWALVPDPSEDLVKTGCYIFYLSYFNDVKHTATITSRFDRNCNSIQ